MKCGNKTKSKGGNQLKSKLNTVSEASSQTLILQKMLFLSCSLKRVLPKSYFSLGNQMHCVVKYHIKNREGFLERYSCKKAVNSEEVVKSHPEKLAMWGVLHHSEAVSNKKSSGTPKPGSARNPEHLGASELPALESLPCGWSQLMAFALTFLLLEAFSVGRAGRFKNKFENFPYSPDTFFSLNCKASVGFLAFLKWLIQPAI